VEWHRTGSDRKGTFGVLVSALVLAFACAPLRTADSEAHAAYAGGMPPAMPAITVARRAARDALAGPGPLIIGGAPARGGSWPWLAFISDRLGPGDDEFCTGTVVAPDLVLTAAHCVEDLSNGRLDRASGFSVMTGSPDRAESAFGHRSRVSDVIAHATNPQTPLLPGGASSVNVVGDAGLLVLVTPTSAPSIALADSADRSLTAPDTRAAIAGWGLTEQSHTIPPTVLEAATTTIQSPAYCAAHNPEFDAIAQLCTIGTPTDRVSICNGDSGAPLATRTSGSRWLEVGIASTSIACDPAQPDTFTRVDYVDSWVTAWAQALNSPVPAPVTTPTRRPAPQVTTYSGRTSQPHGHITVTLARGGSRVSSTELEFTLHCPRGPRGPITTSATWSRPLPLTVTSGAMRLAATYIGRNGWLYSIAAQIPTSGAATGTLAIITRNGACQTGPLGWSAQPTRRDR
jgi:secreted trypsin-like serine protease